MQTHAQHTKRRAVLPQLNRRCLTCSYCSTALKGFPPEMLGELGALPHGARAQKGEGTEGRVPKVLEGQALQDVHAAEVLGVHLRCGCGSALTRCLLALLVSVVCARPVVLSICLCQNFEAVCLGFWRARCSGDSPHRRVAQRVPRLVADLEPHEEFEAAQEPPEVGAQRRRGSATAAAAAAGSREEREAAPLDHLIAGTCTTHTHTRESGIQHHGTEEVSWFRGH